MKEVPLSHKVYAWIVTALFLLPELFAIALPIENWPVTSAPMFAHYVGLETPRYQFRFVGEYGNRKKKARKIRGSKIGLTERKLMRHFFGKVYGSIDPRAPWGHFLNDTPEKFEARLSRFFRGLVIQINKKKKWRKYSKGLQSIRLEVVKLGPDNQIEEKRVVGTFSLKTGQFTHTWKKS